MGMGQAMWNMQLKGLHMCSQVLINACQRGSLQPFQVSRYLLASPSMATSSQLQLMNRAANYLCSPQSSPSSVPPSDSLTATSPGNIGEQMVTGLS